MFKNLIKGITGGKDKPSPARKPKRSPQKSGRHTITGSHGKSASSEAVEKKPVPVMAEPVSDDGDDPFAIPSASPVRPVVSSAPAIRSQQSAANTVSNMEARSPTEEEMEVLDNYEGEVLTAKAIPISKLSRQRCAYLANRWFIIDKTQRHSPYIASVRQELSRSGRHIDRELLVSLTTIREVYQTHDKLFASNQSVRRLDKINGQEAQEFQKEYLGLIEDAFKQNVSDVHVFVRQHETQLAFRINSELDRFAERPANWGHSLCRAAFAMAGEADPQYLPNSYQGARISNIDMPNLPKGVQSIRLQFSPLPGGGRYMVCRILKEGSKNTQDIRDLGYQRCHVQTINKMRRQAEGITVIAGPTGSGKSTTLVVMIASDMKENPGRNVITVEDPPEYIILGAAQFAVLNVKNESEKTAAFSLALGSALRSDPDTVMIGEIRDASSAGLAFKAALTGHRVYASLHANHAVAIMNRLRDIGVDMYNLTEPSLVAGLIGQRLIRVVCPHCRIPLKDATPEDFERNLVSDPELVAKIHEINEASSEADSYQGIFLTNHNGCEHCRGGIKGRAAIAETIAPDEDFMHPIREDRTQEAIQIWLDDHAGMTMQEHAIIKMTKGVCSPQDVLGVAGDFTTFNVKAREERVFGDLYVDSR